MKLKECIYGTPVIDKKMRLGHITGFTYNVSLELTGGMSEQDKFDRTIPLVRFADGREVGIHHGNIEIFKG